MPGAGCRCRGGGVRGLPRTFAQVRGEAAQAAVVQRGCAFAQIVHQQVTDRSAGRPYRSISSSGVRWPAVRSSPQRRRRVRRRRSPSCAQHPVEARRRAPSGCACTSASASSSSRTSPTVISASRPPLAAEDDRARCSVVLSGRGGQVLVLIAHLPATGRTRGSRAAPCRGPALRRRHRRRPARPARAARRQRRSRPVNAAATAGRPAGRGRAGAATGRAAAASRRPALSAPLASHRSCQLSPGWSSSQSSSTPSPRWRCFCAAGVVQHERRAGQPLAAPAPGPALGGRPACSAGARRESAGRRGLPVTRAAVPAAPARGVPRGVGDHDGPFPNSTSSVSGR